MRWLAVDSGEVRVGLAICDREERLAVPLEVVRASAAFPAIRAIVGREGVGGIVIGLPLLPSGDEGEAAAMARRLGERIARTLKVTLVYEDEGLTTVAAEERAREAGKSGSRRSGSRRSTPRRSGRASDDLAATILLEQFLQRRRDAAAGIAGSGVDGAS